jgi:glycerol-3-phosphate O-acyltransferase / dihydroxyacetone phosphate acyltransferase
MGKALRDEGMPPFVRRTLTPWSIIRSAWVKTVIDPTTEREQRRKRRDGGRARVRSRTKTDQQPGMIDAIAGRVGHALMQRLVKLYYPRTEIRGADRLPPGGPVLYVANHANSLIDPIVITMVAHRKVHFLAKAPLFEMPIFGRIMRALGMIPAYRGVDSRAQVKRNLESLDAAADLLAQQCAVGLFPEGKSHDALHIDQVRTGAARIALQAFQRGAKELVIVPLGINYERKERFRSSVWLEVGEPIGLEEWIESQKTEVNDQKSDGGEQRSESESAADANDRRYGRGLTNEIAARLKATVIHLDDPKLEELLDDVEVLLPGFEEDRRTPTGAMRLRKQVAGAMNHYLANEPERAAPLVEAVTNHHQRVEQVGLSIRSPVMRYRGTKLFWLLFGRTIGLLLGIWPMLAGTVHHLVPFVLVRAVSSRFQQPGRMTIALTRLLFGLPVYAAWYMLVWWWITTQFPSAGNWIAWTWSGLMPFAGVFALSYWYRAREASGLWWHQLRALLNRQRLRELRAERDDVMKRLGAMADEYVRTISA